MLMGSLTNVLNTFNKHTEQLEVPANELDQFINTLIKCSIEQEKSSEIKLINEYL